MTTLDAANASDRAQLIKMLGMTSSSRKKPTKYKSKIIWIDGHKFISRREGQHYCELMLLQMAGKISDLKLQVPFPLYAAASPMPRVKVAVYFADFTYTDTQTGEKIVSDVKGMKTAMYSLKKKLLKANYGISILEVF